MEGVFFPFALGAWGGIVRVWCCGVVCVGPATLFSSYRSWYWLSDLSFLLHSFLGFRFSFVSYKGRITDYARISPIVLAVENKYSKNIV